MRKKGFCDGKNEVLKRGETKFPRGFSGWGRDGGYFRVRSLEREGKKSA